MRRTGGLVGMVAAVGVGLWCLSWLGRPDLSAKPPQYSPEEIEEAKRARDVRFDPSDPSKLPRIQVDVDYSEGPAARWWPKGESPILAELVKQGLLPPVHERVGPMPIVMRGVEGIGRYGGTWQRVATSTEDIGQMVRWRQSYAGLFRWSPLGYPIVPHFALRLTPNENRTVWVLELRPGLRWSDGHPFTVDDILYWYEYETLDTSVGGGGTVPVWLRTEGKQGRLEKIDDLRLRFVFEKPHTLLLEWLACNSYLMCESPKHYLSKYHPRLGDRAFLEAEKKAFGQASDRALYAYMRHFLNPECPRMWPWIYRSYRSSPPQVFVRNPYYPAVDEEGNQLPYIDRVQFQVLGRQMLPLAFSHGQVSMQTRHVKYENYTDLMTQSRERGFRVLHWYPAARSVWLINPNVARLVDERRPETKWKAKLLADKRFRQALSLAINRAEIIKAEWNNQVRPSQVEPGPESPFHYPKLGQAYIEYDPARANALLDELGLRQRDVDGMRTFPDGTTMTFYLDYSEFTGIGPAQMVVDDWAAVGVRVIARERARTIFEVQTQAGDFDMVIWTSESDYFPLLEPRVLIPRGDAWWARRWSAWYGRGGFYGDPAAKMLPAPPEDHPTWRSMAAYERALQALTFEEQKKAIEEAMDIAAEHLWTINIAEAPPQLVVVQKGFRNVPRNALYGARLCTPGNAGVETYFFEEPKESAGAMEEIRQSLIEIRPRPRQSVEEANRQLAALEAAQKQKRWMGRLIKWGLTLCVVVGLGLAGLRHPFVIRRLFILVPTLLIISVVVFTIIQLPPGDFLTSRLIQLREAGDEAAMKQIEELRKLFHFDEPVWMQYARWMGFRWFFTFRPEDKGLLQGNMGRSMETLERVNDMVGDRITLTVVVTLLTMLFTWAVALPIGIYSAVRQYSLSDYLLTLIGFLGMSAPGFLLALVLMTLAGVGPGLFSPEYDAQPEWTWGKVVDLMKHIWIPVVVLGIAGTASMIRIMRANLLDELRKPYVVTARAKGVRPVKLLLKYPVRVALNPFVSGIGHLFPHLVSGGTIVAIVLALPMVGPLLLTALLSQDMYMAGSMLMVLSVLSVLGTLVSDLLLLWLDPRIRYEGGSR